MADNTDMTVKQLGKLLELSVLIILGGGVILTFLAGVGFIIFASAKSIL